METTCVYNFSDYLQIYDLTPSDLSKSIFDFSPEITAFYTESKKRGMNVTAGNLAQLPNLPYKKHQFDLALCTDFIFHHLLSAEKIASVVKELCRVATEVRLFPLLNHQGKMSEQLGPLMLMLQQHNYGVEVRVVPYESLQNGNAMLRVWEQECKL